MCTRRRRPCLCRGSKTPMAKREHEVAPQCKCPARSYVTLPPRARHIYVTARVRTYIPAPLFLQRRSEARAKESFSIMSPACPLSPARPVACSCEQGVEITFTRVISQQVGCSDHSDNGALQEDPGDTLVHSHTLWSSHATKKHFLPTVTLSYETFPILSQLSREV